MERQARQTAPDVMPEPAGNAPVLAVRNLSKSFPGIQALAGVSLAVQAGSVHALMGENGAGKSTLVKILLGLHRPDGGEILLHGRRVRMATPHEALRHGIAMVHQELAPFPNLTVAENICIGREPTRWMPGWIHKAAMNRRAEELLGHLGLELAPTRLMGSLSVAEMQLVEIAKALAADAGVIVMDEPTSALSARETEALFAVIEELKRRGVAVIYISHKMDEVFRIADTVTILRDGRHITTRPIDQLEENTLIALMVGHELEAVFPRRVADPGEVALEVRNLSQEGRFHDISFQVRRGEILGIAGLMGAGRTELACAIYGLAPAGRGEIRLEGRPVRISNPADAMAHGIAMVGEDRKADGLVSTMSVQGNITLASLRRCRRGPLIDRQAENGLADERIRALAIKVRDRNQPVQGLSGGNQQKVVIARALLTEPAVLILDEPTRGIDVGAKAEVYALIAALASEGRAIILVSSEMLELLALSDRILVMREGTLVAELDPRHTTQEEVLKYAMPG